MAESAIEHIMRMPDGREVEMLPIREFAPLVDRRIQSIRYYIFHGGMARKLSAYRDGCTLYIPKSEVAGFPLVPPGGQDLVVRHFLSGQCNICTTKPGGCAAAQKAREEAELVGYLSDGEGRREWL